MKFFAKYQLTLGIATLALLLSGCNASNDFPDDSNNPETPAVSTGLYTMTSAGVERSYYIVMPDDTTMQVSASAIDELPPLIVGFPLPCHAHACVQHLRLLPGDPPSCATTIRLEAGLLSLCHFCS